MRILYLHQYFATPKAATGTRSYEFGRRWQGSGHDVHVVTSRAADATLPLPGEKGTIEGMEVDIVGVAYRNEFGFVRRVLAFLAFAGAACVRVLTCRRPSVIVATSTPLTIAIPALCAKWFRGIPFVFEVRDVWPDAAIDAGVLRSRVLIRLAKAIESLAYRNASAVVALSTGMRDRIRERVPSRTPLEVITNASDIDAFAPSETLRGEARSQLCPQGEFLIVYTGTLGLANDVDALVRLIQLSRRFARVRWVIAGGGSDLPKLVRAVGAEDASRVAILGPRPKDEIRRLLAAADLGVVSFIGAPTYFDNSPNKFFDYCAAGVPVLYTRSTWAAELISEYSAGFVSRDPELLDAASYIAKLVDDTSALEAARVGARRMAEMEFSRDELAARFLSVIQCVVARERGGHGGE